MTMCLDIDGRINGVEDHRHLEIENIRYPGLSGQNLQGQEGTCKIPDNGKEDPGQEGDFDRPPEILLKGHADPCGDHIGMQAVVPDGIAFYPLVQVIPDNHRITLRRSSIWARTFFASIWYAWNRDATEI